MGERGEGAEREIKSITIDPVCETVAADGRKQEEEGDREWWAGRMRCGAGEENERGP